MSTLTYTEFVEEVATATATINTAAKQDPDLLNYVCEEVADRLALYLNLPIPAGDEDVSFDAKLVKIAARISSGVFTQTTTNVAGDSVDTTIQSVSDNGQSITYGDTTRNYLATATDGELFGGCAELLRPYRRCNVVS